VGDKYFLYRDILGKRLYKRVEKEFNVKQSYLNVVQWEARFVLVLEWTVK